MPRAGRWRVTAEGGVAVADYAEVREAGLVDVKGKTEPVRMYEALRELPMRTRFDASIARGLTPYVGREQDLALLRGSFELAQQGHGRVVFLAGEPGIGKSRLLLEFRRSLESEARWMEGHCLSLG